MQTVKAQAPAASTVAAPAATKMSVETIRARAKAAVLGAIVADAATMVGAGWEAGSAVDAEQ